MLLCCRLQYDPALLCRAEAVSLPARREKAARLESMQAKAASLAAGLLLRRCLWLSGLDETALRVDPKGRPYLEGERAFVSLSHSGDYAACALAAVPVGVDIQRIVVVSERAVRRFCSEAERSRLAQSSDPGRAAIELWALKESYLKASGALTEEVFRTGFAVAEDGTVTGPEGWRFALDSRIEGYCLAVCRKAQDRLSPG